MSSTKPVTANLAPPAIDMPEDVLAELDTEQRRVTAEPLVGAPVDTVPEDVLAERDLEARLGDEDIHQRLTEGRPPVEEEPRS